jgi:hypothetical protein
MEHTSTFFSLLLLGTWTKVTVGIPDGKIAAWRPARLHSLGRAQHGMAWRSGGGTGGGATTVVYGRGEARINGHWCQNNKQHKLTTIFNGVIFCLCTTTIRKCVLGASVSIDTGAYTVAPPWYTNERDANNMEKLPLRIFRSTFVFHGVVQAWYNGPWLLPVFLADAERVSGIVRGTETWFSLGFSA